METMNASSMIRTRRSGERDSSNSAEWGTAQNFLWFRIRKQNIPGVNERHISGNERHKANRSSQNHPPHETEKVLLQKVIYE